MRAFLIATIIALLTIPAAAQGMGTGMGGGGKKRHSDQAEQKGPVKPKVDDKGYRSALDRLPDKKYDPWANQR